MAVEVGSRNGELENGLKQRESRGRGTIGWVVERRMVEVEEVRMARGKLYLAGDTHAKCTGGRRFVSRIRARKLVHTMPVHTCARVSTKERVLKRKGSSSDEDSAGVAGSREKEELEVRHGRRCEGVLEVGASTRERERVV
ncbi:hypothetical protein ALC53_08196 [Atta colombica]|uniref:Uncharacterized protein n=1 Tax=Atta colombica TaxID=520822 RepID=A0A195BA65_9HYME|nr:hypothetical protein ALC53_08196 [Atta colombica]